MKVYLIKTGLLVVREDCSFFTANNGMFRRMASSYEVEGLIGEKKVKEVSILDTSFAQKLAEIDPPMWRYLWTVKEKYYADNENEPDYYVHEHFFARWNENEWEVRSIETRSTALEFPYVELTGNYESGLSKVKILGALNAPDKFLLTDQIKEPEVVIDKLFSNMLYSFEDAIEAQNYVKGPVKRGKYLPLTPAEKIHRQKIAEGLGIKGPFWEDYEIG